jgi:hypothetical protein
MGVYPIIELMFARLRDGYSLQPQRTTDGRFMHSDTVNTDSRLCREEWVGAIS